MLQTGCQSDLTLPEWHGKQVGVTSEQPHDKCDWPDITATNIDGTTGGFLAKPQLEQLGACREIADKTYDVATANAAAVDALIGALNETNEIGERQTELAEFQLNELNRDRHEAEVEAWTYKGLLALVLIIVAL